MRLVELQLGLMVKKVSTLTPNHFLNAICSNSLYYGLTNVIYVKIYIFRVFFVTLQLNEVLRQFGAYLLHLFLLLVHFLALARKLMDFLGKLSYLLFELISCESLTECLKIGQYILKVSQLIVWTNFHI